MDLPHDSAARRVRQRHVGEATRGRTPATPACGRRCRVDEELGLVYLPVELPTGDYYGGHRPGNGLFGESLVAVDLQDRQAQVALPARAPRHLGHGHPVRADPRRHHRQRPARSRRVAQPTKQGWVYVFDRATGAAGVADRRAAGRRRATCRASGTRRRSRSRPSRRRSTARASRSTT